ncbi:cytochrome b5 [Schizopora paradoxa]|uniref:Cytochrome b5 n=1 Tax=Schizopora paradoxa TaxID=27342 RepID=A0A0H2RWF1_9AGAM|nr:cytochrome b5 [Schizopora paradoxa]
MSWIMNPTGDQAPRVDDSEKVADYSGRKVSTKSANQPFLSYTRYREKQKEEHEAWLKRKKEREEKIAKGESVGPEERDPTAEEEVGLLGLLKFIVYVLLFSALAGKFFTGSFVWNFEDSLPSLKQLWPTDQRLFSEEGLAKFDGSDPNKPIYLAIDHDVYDVTEGRKTYGPGGSYHFMAGRDAARAFGTGCFATHRTHDLRGLTERELKVSGVQHWKDFFAKSKKYTKIGRVQHRPIDPASPIPEPCKEKKTEEQPTKETKEEARPQSKHEEL